MGSANRLAAEARAIVPLLDYQRRAVESPARFCWSCWSRQTGKSFTQSLRRVLRGLMRRRNQILLSAGERQSRELMLKVRQHCQALNIASSLIGGREEDLASTALSVELPNGVRIIGLPANPRTARGFTGDVFLDEFAMHRDDREIWAGVFPSVLRDDGELDVASTPRGRDNLFAELRENPQFEHSIVTLEQAIAAGLRVDAEELRRSMNDELLFRQEFLCEFLDEAAAFLTYEQIARAEDAGLVGSFDLVRLGAARHPLFAGMDIGRYRDLTVLWVVERCPATELPAAGAARADSALLASEAGSRRGTGSEPGGGCTELLITRGIRESTGEPFREQWAALRALMSLRSVRRCCIDASGMGLPLAEAAIEAFGSARVEAVTFTAAVKDELASRLRLRVEDGTIRIPPDETIRSDWHSVRRSVTAAGPARYEAARSDGGHADRFWAACLAVRAASGGAGAVEAVRGTGLKFARCGVW